MPNEEPFYEVQVEIQKSCTTTVVVHLRADSPEEACRRAAEAVGRECASATSDHDLRIDSSDFWEADYTYMGNEEALLIEQGKKSSYSPSFDLRDDPTDAERAAIAVAASSQYTLPFD